MIEHLRKKYSTCILHSSTCHSDYNCVQEHNTSLFKHTKYIENARYEHFDRLKQFSCDWLLMMKLN